MDYQELENRIKRLENNQIAVTMSFNTDTNVLRSVQRSTVATGLAFGSAIPVSIALIDLSGSNNKGLVLSRMTTTQRDALVNPVAGLIIFNTSTSKLNFYTGAAWEAVTSV